MRDLFTTTVEGAAAFERARASDFPRDDLPTPAELAEDDADRKQRMRERAERERRAQQEPAERRAA